MSQMLTKHLQYSRNCNKSLYTRTDVNAALRVDYENWLGHSFCIKIT